MSSQTSIVDLPPEILEIFFQKISATKDVGNCSIALVGTRHEKFVMENFLKPQLKIFASLDLNLKESLRNEGWFEECQDTKLIVKLWKEFQPSLPGKVFLINIRDDEVDILNLFDSLISKKLWIKNFLFEKFIYHSLIEIMLTFVLFF